MRCKHDGLREADAVSVAFEVTRDAKPLGVIATKAGVDASGFERIDGPGGVSFRQA